MFLKFEQQPTSLNKESRSLDCYCFFVMFQVHGGVFINGSAAFLSFFPSVAKHCDLDSKLASGVVQSSKL